MTLYQTLVASMDITSDVPDLPVCDIFMKALKLDGFNATCPVVVSHVELGKAAVNYFFRLRYPLEPAERVAAKTAKAKALIVAADFPDKMAAAAANLNAANGQVGRRLNVLSVDADSVTAWFSFVPSECASARILGPQDTPGSSGRLAAAWAASCEPPPRPLQSRCGYTAPLTNHRRAASDHLRRRASHDHLIGAGESAGRLHSPAEPEQPGPGPGGQRQRHCDHEHADERCPRPREQHRGHLSLPDRWSRDQRTALDPAAALAAACAAAAAVASAAAALDSAALAAAVASAHDASTVALGR